MNFSDQHCHGLRRLLAGLCAALAISVFPTGTVSAIEPQNVLVLYNADQGTDGAGYQIADYYSQARPGVHLLGVTGIDSLLTGDFRETIGSAGYLDVIRPQVLSAIANIPNTIDVIVTTKGMPLKIDAGVKQAGSPILTWKRYSSLESELTRIDSIDTRDKLGDQFIYTGFPDIDPTLAANPYYNSNEPFRHVGSDPVNGDIRLASRLDGFDVETVKSTIDRAQNVVLLPESFTIVADDDPSAGTDQMVDSVPGGPGPGLLAAVRNKRYDLLYDNTDAALTTSDRPIRGYVSHGTADGSGGLEPRYLEDQLDFDFADGAVFLTHESWNAASFDPSYQMSQGLVAQWLSMGGTAGLGHVHEPSNGADNVTNEDLLFDALLPASKSRPGDSGMTFVEAAWNATRQLSYVNTVVGDPLMKWTNWIPGDADLDGEVDFKDFYTLQGNWLSQGTLDDGDFNNDGQVNLDDFYILEEHWLTVSQVTALSNINIQVRPFIDATTGLPDLHATLISPGNFDGDLDVDSDDLKKLQASIGVDAGGDVDGDGDTDGRDFLAWQQYFFEYTLEADFDFNALVATGDLEIWQNAYDKNRGGDTDGDGDSDGRDFLRWQREFNAPLPTTTLALIVPEPSAISLFALIAVFTITRSTRRRVF